MTAARVAFATVLIVTAALLQVTLLTRLQLPGATPDLLLVAVLALALVRGPFAGAVIGGLAGLLADVMPPAAGTVGLTALILGVAGYLAGRFAQTSERSALASLLVVAMIAPLTVVARAAMLGLFGDIGPVWGEVPWLMLTEAGYALLISAFVVPFVAAVDRRLEPDPERRLR